MKKLIKQPTILLTLLIIFLTGFYIFTFYQDSQIPKVTVGNTTFKIELAKTPEERELGLGHRESLPLDHGMLFLFDSPGQYGFWMRGMKFPLDIIFISNNKIAGIFENLPPAPDSEIYPPTYGGNLISNRVLEINAGLAKKYNFKTGDRVQIQIP